MPSPLPEHCGCVSTTDPRLSPARTKWNGRGLQPVPPFGVLAQSIAPPDTPTAYVPSPSTTSCCPHMSHSDGLRPSPPRRGKESPICTHIFAHTQMLASIHFRHNCGQPVNPKPPYHPRPFAIAMACAKVQPAQPSCCERPQERCCDLFSYASYTHV